MARSVEQLDVRTDDLGPLLERAHRMARARDGWINLWPLPEDDPDELPIQEFAPTPLDAPVGIFARFRRVLVIEGTWVPGRDTKRGIDETSIGLVHPAGRFAVRQLRDGGQPVPSTWRVVTDHPKRGLVLAVDDAGSDRARETQADAILSWLPAAGAVLAPQQITGVWRAFIHRR
jgi:hypothetical protein